MILLVQFRTDQSGWHEIKCVYEATGLAHNNIAIVNAANEKTSAEDIIDEANKADLVLLGGVGESGFEAETDKAKKAFLAAKRKMEPVIEHLTYECIPTLGLCFGHQLIADILGGKVTEDSTLAETGIAKICLTEKGKSDKLLQSMDECFPAVVGHKVSVTDLPDNCTKLAESDCCPIQAFRFQDVIYGFQFHPELTEETLNDRLEMYPEYKNYDLENSFDQPITAKNIISQAITISTEKTA